MNAIENKDENVISANNTDVQMAMISGQTQQKQLNEVDKKKLRESFAKLFYGLTLSNWAAGKTLGQAWYVALQQMDAFIKTKPANDPAKMYLHQLAAANKVRAQKDAMTNPNKDKKLNLENDNKLKYTKQAAELTNTGLKGINTTLDKYKTNVQETKKDLAKQNTFNNAQKKMQLLMQQQMQMWQQQNARAA